VAPVSPRGMTKFKIALVAVPLLVTTASVPGSLVVVVPTVIVAASPSSPSAPAGPVGPAIPAGP